MRTLRGLPAVWFLAVFSPFISFNMMYFTPPAVQIRRGFISSFSPVIYSPYYIIIMSYLSRFRLNLYIIIDYIILCLSTAGGLHIVIYDVYIVVVGEDI